MISRWSKHSSRTLRTHCSAYALAIWSPIRRQNDFDALGGKHRIKGCGKLRVTVMQEKPHRAPFLLELPHQLTCLLGHPGCGGLRSAGSYMNPAGADLKKEEHIQRLQPQRFHGEEITR